MFSCLFVFSFLFFGGVIISRGLGFWWVIGLGVVLILFLGIGFLVFLGLFILWGWGGHCFLYFCLFGFGLFVLVFCF